jgi:DNA-binding transcriptional LysR family regulator
VSGLDANALVLLADIVDAGSLSAAGRKLQVSRANVSYRLVQLERAAGAELVRRTTRRLEVTEVGQRVYEHAARMRAELRAAEEALQPEQSPQGLVRLSVPTGYGDVVMSAWLLEFKRLHPQVTLEVTFENRVQDLVREEIDVAVRVMSEPPPSLVARALRPVRYVACASVAYATSHALPAHPDELRGMPLITSNVVGRQLKLSAYRDEERREVALEPTLMSENFAFLRSAILAGLGVGLVPDYVVEEACARGDVVTALDAWRLSIFGTHMYMLYMPGRFRTLAARTLIAFIVDRARGEGG